MNNVKVKLFIRKRVLRSTCNKYIKEIAKLAQGGN